MRVNDDFLLKQFMIHNDIFAKLGHKLMKDDKEEQFKALSESLILNQPIYMVDPRNLGVKKLYFAGVDHGQFWFVDSVENLKFADTEAFKRSNGIGFKDLPEMLLSSYHGQCDDFTKMVYLNRQVAEREIKKKLMDVLSVESENSFAKKIKGMRSSDILVSYINACNISFETVLDNPECYDVRLLIGNVEKPYLVVDSVNDDLKPFKLHVQSESTDNVATVLETGNLEQVVTALEILADDKGIEL